MIPKPKHLQPPYGAQFKDATVVAAYQYRPEYPPELFEIVASLISDAPRRVLDVGCGTGYVARRLVDYRCSTNQDFRPYNLFDELTQRGLFEIEGQQETAPVTFTQSADHYLESWHARNGLSRQRMGEQAAVFDQEVRQLLQEHCPDGQIESTLRGHVTWGKPLNPE